MVVRFFALSNNIGTFSPFLRRKLVKLTHSGVLTDYQYYETFDYEPVMLNNFDDIRFTTQSDEHIPYWIETKTDGVSAKVWFMNDYLDGDTYIWMYYGSEGLSSGSAISDTFIFGDDFTSAIDWVNNWQSTNQGLFAIDSNTLKMSTTTTVDMLNSISTFSSPVIVESKIKTDPDSRCYIQVEPSIDSWASQDFVGFDRGGTNEYHISIGDTDYKEVTTVSANWHYIKYSNPASGNVQWDIYDGAVLKHSQAGTPTNRDNWYLTLSQHVGAYTYIDWIFIRKYTAVEPTVTVGAEQHPRTGNIMIL